MSLKYIQHSVIGFVLWDRTDEMYHSHMAEAVNKRVGRGKIISAGFASLHPEVKCYGMSESLNIRSTPECTANLRKFLGVHDG